jgi:hypothetical protein
VWSNGLELNQLRRLCRPPPNRPVPVAFERNEKWRSELDSNQHEQFWRLPSCQLDDHSGVAGSVGIEPTIFRVTTCCCTNSANSQNGGRGRDRTFDLRVFSSALYRLSYPSHPLGFQSLIVPALPGGTFLVPLLGLFLCILFFFHYKSGANGLASEDGH